MTSNQVAAKKAADEIRETRRANRAREDQAEAEAFAKYGKTGTKSYLRQGRVRDDVADARDRLGSFKGALEIGKDIVSLLPGFGIKANINDASWYNKDPQLVKDSGTYSFNYPVGLKDIPVTGGKFERPGFLALHYAPVLSELGSATGVGNVSAYNFYSYIRHANSGSRNYEAPDLLMYILGVQDAYAFVALLTRVYSVLRTYKFHNRTYAIRMATEMLMSIVDNDNEHAQILAEHLLTDLPGFRLFINTLVTRLGVLCVPKDISLFNRRVWMNSSIFKDEEIHGSVDYFFVPAYFYSFKNKTPDGQPHSSYLTPVQGNMDGTLGMELDVSGLRQLFDRLYGLLFTDEDIGIMSGDILKAYGEAGVYHFPQIPEDYHVESFYSLEVLSQIKNATVEHYSLATETWAQNLAIVQDTNGVICYGQSDTNTQPGTPGSGVLAQWPSGKLTFSGGDATQRDRFIATITDNHILDMYKDDVNSDDVMVATRLMYHLTPTELVDGKNTGIFSAEFCGTEILFSTRIDDPSFNSAVVSSNFNTISHSTFITLFAKADWSPTIYRYFNSGTGNVWYNFSEMHNFTVLSSQNLSRLHEVATFSLISIPLTGLSKR